MFKGLSSLLFLYYTFFTLLLGLDTATDQAIAEVHLFDPTPREIRDGRPHLYNTQKTSGTGHTSCASCHLDGRFDRLAWDLGSPEGVTIPIDPEASFISRLKPPEVHSFHPMKGPMMTMTLQDIIGHEPFHWRGDRFGIEAFNPTFTDLQGAPKELSHRAMAEFKAFLATLHFPPNRYRSFSNRLSRTVPLSGHPSLGRDGEGDPKGTPFESGDAIAGLSVFKGQGGCAECHTLSTGLGPHQRFASRRWQPIPDGPMGERHVSLVQQSRSNDLPFKIASLRGLSEKVGANFLGTESQVGFGFAHNGAVDSLTRFIQDGFNFVEDKSTADLIAFLLSFTGSEISLGNERNESDSPGLLSKDTHASVGTQFLLHGGESIPDRLQLAFSMASNRSDPVDVVVFQQGNENSKGWYYNPDSELLEPDGNEAPIRPEQLLQSAQPSNSFLFMIVPPLTGNRMALDWDTDGTPNRTEMQAGWDPYSARSTPMNLPPIFEPVPPQSLEPGSRLELELYVTDGNDPPDAITLSLMEESPQNASIRRGTTIFWDIPNETSDQPWIFHVEAVDEGTPPEKTTLVFPVFSGTRLSSPFLSQLEIDTTGVRIQWRVTPGRTYQVSYTENIRHSAWFPLTPPWLADQVTLEIKDERIAARSRFYKIAILED
jgi:mono/diheme cytochrome c family protein